MLHALHVVLLLTASVCTYGKPAIFQVPQSAWTSLNQTVRGNLYAGTPEFLPCFTTYDNGNSTTVNNPDLSACGTAQKGRADGPTISSYFGGYEFPNWGQCQADGSSCSVSAISPLTVQTLVQTCHQGSVPNYYIDSSNPAHMQAGITFAKKYAIPLVIKNTGHDHRGRSSAPFSLAVWYELEHSVQWRLADGHQDSSHSARDRIRPRLHPGRVLDVHGVCNHDIWSRTRIRATERSCSCQWLYGETCCYLKDCATCADMSQ